MGDINRALGGGSEFEYKDKKYKLSPWDYRTQASYERYLEGEAFKALKRLKPLLSADDYKEQLNMYQKDVAIGVYTFGSEYVVKSWQFLPNFKHLVFLMLQKNHPELTGDDVSKMIDEMYEDIVVKVTEANADPTASEGNPETQKT